MIHDAPCLTVNDKTLLRRFLDRFGINQDDGVDVLIPKVAAAFSHVPYENLTKIIKADAIVNPKSAMRLPDELIGDYLRWGTGGTCFSLTAAITAVYDALGVPAYPILADRHYGADTHSGVVIQYQTEIYIIDPGYLLFTPVPLSGDKSTLIETGTNTLELKPLVGGEKVELYTIRGKDRKLRLTYKMAPVDAAQLSRVWEASFAWEMMTYPVLTKRAGGAQRYFQGSKFMVYTENESSKTVVGSDDKARIIASSFGIDPKIIKKALEIVG
jgi:arylamine N-acetyltransferase